MGLLDSRVSFGGSVQSGVLHEGVPLGEDRSIPARYTRAMYPRACLVGSRKVFDFLRHINTYIWGV